MLLLGLLVTIRLIVRARRFGCREIKVPSVPIFLTQFTDMLFYFVNRHLYLNIMNRYCWSDRRNNLRVTDSD